MWTADSLFETEGLEEVLAWDWKPEMAQKAADQAQTKSGQSLAQIRGEVQSVKVQVSDLKNQVSLLSSSVEGLRTSIQPLVEKAKRGSWFRHYWKWLVGSGIASGMLLVALATLLLPIYRSHSAYDLKNAINDRIEDKVGKDLRSLEKDVASVKATVEQINRDLASPRAARSLREIGALDQKEFPKALPSLRKALEQPASEVRPDQGVLGKLMRRLRNVDESAPDYWPTVLQFIQFASAGLSAGAPAPGPPQIMIRSNKGFANLGPITNTVVLLDGGDLGYTTFVKCRIVFTEHPVRMRNVMFVDCVFEMPKTDNPNPYLRRASQALLAANLKSVSIPSL